MTDQPRRRTSMIAGSLRLEGPQPRRRSVVGDAEAGGGDANYYNKLITLFPAEALTLYGIGLAVFGGSTLGALLVCLAILIYFRWEANKPREGGPTDKAAVAVAVISFLLWTTATDPHWLAGLDPVKLGLVKDATGIDAFFKAAQKWATFLGAAFVLIAPAAVKAPPPPPEPDLQAP